MTPAIKPSLREAVDLSMFDGFVVSDLVGPFIKSSNPWDDFRDFSGDGEDLFESTEVHPGVLRLFEAAGLADSCRQYFLALYKEGRLDDASFEDWKTSDFVVPGTSKAYYEIYGPRRVDIVKKALAMTGQNMDTKAVAPKKEFDPSQASKGLLTTLSLFDKGEEAAKNLEDQVDGKYEKVYDLAYGIAAKTVNSRHGLIGGDAGIGKSFTVNQAINKGLAKSGLELVEAGGDAAGSSMTSMIEFFFRNREGKLVIMDDSDGILTVRDQGINNALKVFLNPEPKMFTMASTINVRLNKIFGAQRARESAIIIDTSRLKDHIVSFRDGAGDKLCEETLTDVQVKFYEKLKEELEFKEPSKKRMLENYAKTGIYSRIREDGENEEDTGDDDDEDWGDDEDGEDLDVNEQVPMSFVFKSRTIFISNLKRDQLSDAVRSRFDIEELSLTNEEFIARLRKIIGTMNVNQEGAHSKEDAEWAKKVVYGLLCILVEAYESGANLGGTEVILGGKLQFRLVPQLVDKWMSMVYKYIERNGKADHKKIEGAIMKRFITLYALPSLANLRDSKRAAG